MKTYCLVIDDDNQEDYFDQKIKKVLQKNHIELIPIYIKTKDRDYIKNDHSGLDKSKIEDDCLQAIKKHNCSIVVSDYQIATANDDFNGLDILNSISEKYPLLYKILYSGGDIDKAIKKIQNSFIKTEPNQKLSDEEIINAIYQLKKMSYINDFIRGKGYAEAVIKFIRCSPLILQQSFLSQFKEDYPDMIFQSCYPPFKGWRLKAIAEEIEKRTPRGGEFQQSLISQVIAYLIETNEEKNE